MAVARRHEEGRVLRVRGAVRRRAVPQQRGDGARAPEARRQEEGLEAVAVARRHRRAVLREAVDRRRPVRHELARKTRFVKMY